MQKQAELNGNIYRCLDLTQTVGQTTTTALKLTWPLALDLPPRLMPPQLSIPPPTGVNTLEK